LALSVYLDANVIVSIFVEDVFSKRAEAFLESSAQELLLSTFVRAEFASVVNRLLRMKRLSKMQAQQLLSDFDLWAFQKLSPVETRTADIQEAEALLRSFSSGLRAPDAINIVTAQRLGAELATFDRDMAKVASGQGIILAKM
jgi:uncharacterized protein